MKHEENWPRDKPKSSKLLHKEERSRREDSLKACSYCNRKQDHGHMCQAMEDLKKNGLCFTCHGPWEHGHRCKRKRKVHKIGVTPKGESQGQSSKKTRYKEGDLKSIQSGGAINK